ncbi:MAG: serine protease [Candidatus Rokuibacteriota bacterium]|nr:MAG: serine protease [Candidatus Rokubacteria bacterium]
MMLDLAGLAEDLRRITVEVTDQPDQALGSGVLWPPGYVVTNAHVVRRPRVTLQLVDGRRLTGELLARDADADLALIRAPGAGMPVATLGDPDAARIGSLVVAVGHPRGVRAALTAGIIHAIGPIVHGGVSWIQADLRLAPGNSGGPLADAAGRVVGLNARVAGSLALAVPMSQVRRFVRAAGVA